VQQVVISFCECNVVAQKMYNVKFKSRLNNILEETGSFFLVGNWMHITLSFRTHCLKCTRVSFTHSNSSQFLKFDKLQLLLYLQHVHTVDKMLSLWHWWTFYPVSAILHKFVLYLKLLINRKFKQYGRICVLHYYVQKLWWF